MKVDSGINKSRLSTMQAENTDNVSFLYCKAAHITFGNYKSKREKHQHLACLARKRVLRPNAITESNTALLELVTKGRSF